VGDNCAGIDVVLRHGQDGEIYNIGGGKEGENVGVTPQILELGGKPLSLITPVAHPPGHHRRHGPPTGKTPAVGWKAAHPLAAALAATVAWYRENDAWWRPIKSGAFRAYYEQQYAKR